MFRLARIAPLLIAPLLPGVSRGADDTWTKVDRIVAIGDVHGDYDAFLSVLRTAGLIDDKLKWSGGKTHLVQTGDVLDRGPDSRKILDLIEQLQKQARSSGGYVHPLIGNHEAMNVYGDLRYVSAGEYEAFRTPDSAQVRDQFFKQHLEEERLPNPPVQYRTEWDEKHPLGYFEHRYNLGSNGKYGRRIRRQNTLIKINDILFQHAGLSAEYASYSIRELNERIREELDDFKKLEGGFVLDQKAGPLWFRGLAEGGPELTGHVDALLAKHGVSRIVIGHTPTGGAILPRFGGKVLVIDVGLSRAFGGPPACVVFDGAVAHVIHRGTRVDLPSPSAESILAYLQRIAELEPAGSPVRKQAAEFETALAAPIGR